MPDLAQFASNPHGVAVLPLDYGKKGMPTTKVYHGAGIIVNNAVVGRITSWQVNAYNRTLTHIREVSYATWGRPVDLVPGISDGYSISFDRVEVWDQELEKAFGYNATFDDLADQTYPFQIQEWLMKGSGTPYQIWTYEGCWFETRNESARSADGDGIIRIEGGSIKYVYRHKGTP